MGCLVSGLTPGDPLRDRGWGIGREPLQQSVRGICGDQHPAMHFLDELFGDGMIQEPRESIKIAVDIEQSAGLAMKAKLSSRPGLKDLLQGSDAAR